MVKLIPMKLYELYINIVVHHASTILKLTFPHFKVRSDNLQLFKGNYRVIGRIGEQQSVEPAGFRKGFATTDHTPYIL